MSVTLLRGNALALPLADDSVDLVVTSPPYFGLRSYTDGGEHYAGQLGSEATPAEFLDALIAATAEMVRVLKPSGSLWINLGDKYGGSSNDDDNLAEWSAQNSRGGGHKVRPARPARRTVAGVRAKSLIGIPWRYALRCIGHGTALADPDVVRLLLRDVAAGVLPLWAAEHLVDELAATPDDGLGLILRAEVIWSKPNGLPESVTDRARRSHEQWFHFTKRPRYYAAGTAANPLGKLPGSVWTIPTQPLTVPAELGADHFAAFPMEWPRRLILGWSPPGICTECGEGRRPVVVSGAAFPRAEIASRRSGSVNPDRKDGSTTNGVSGQEYNAWRAANPHVITGYACACTPYTDHPGTGESSGPDHRDAVAAGAYVRSPDANGKGETSLQNRPGVGPWREYHFDRWTPAPTRPAVVLDVFGGTGTTALVADALGRHGISLDMSRDYGRIARWRTTDPGQRAAALQVQKPAPVAPAQDDLLAMLDGEVTA